MTKGTKIILIILLSAVVISTFALLQTNAQQAQQKKGVASVNTQTRVDVLKMPRPIDMHDTVWIEDLTSLEVRDLIKSGKTTALVLSGGMEENGPYLTLGKHNNVMRAMGDSIARKLGNALCAPIVTMEPGKPAESKSPGSVVLSPETFRAIMADMAESLRAQGFKNVVFLGDHGGDQGPITEASKMLNERWKGSGAMTYYVADFYDYAGVEKYEQDVLGIHEKLEGYHDDYYISSIIMTVDQNGVRLPERIKAHKTTINSIDLAPASKAIANGKKIVDFRTEITVKALQKMMAESRTSQQ